MAAISKEEYLKRYMSNSDDSKPKKKRKKVKGASKSSGVKIYDDDIAIAAVAPKIEDIEEAPFLDEAPQVAGLVDERPEDIVQIEQYRTDGKWKLMGKDDDIKPEDLDSGRMQHDSDSDQSPHRIHQDTDANQSPLRKQKYIPHHRKQRHDSESDSDLSPPRHKSETKSKRTRHDSDSDSSPPRHKSETRSKRTRHDSDSDSDFSPPRLKTKHASSPVRPQKHKANSAVLPHSTKKRTYDSDQSPPRRRHDSDSDLSPPRKSRQRYDSDLSPPRISSKVKTSSQKKYESDSDQSPPRKHSKYNAHSKQKYDSDSDLSPPRSKVKTSSRKKYQSDSDQSPPRKSSGGRRQEKKATKTLSGSKAGLSDAATLRRENQDRRRRETETFTKMSEEVSGRHAETVYRDKEGKKRNLKFEKLKQREEEAKAMEKAEQYMEWGRGVTQSKQVRDTVEDQMYEMSKPLARYKDDRDLDDMLKQRERDEDPMLAFLKKKQAKQAVKAGIKEKPRYKGPQPPANRFNIWPGYRWDGVDRSNGFEKKWFQRMSDKKATSEIAYKWSIEDM